MNKIIGIDVYSALHSPRGMGTYTINFLKELAEIDKETNYRIYYPNKIILSLKYYIQKVYFIMNNLSYQNNAKRIK